MKCKMARTMILLSVIFFVFTGCNVSSKKMMQINQNTIDTLSDRSIGDEIQFGVYDKKPIVWNVVDIQDGMYLLVSKEAVFHKAYNDKGGSWDVTSELFHANEWAQCSLRTYLNGEFFETSFDDVAKSVILQCHLNNSVEEAYAKSGGNNTVDKVFVLSFSEAVSLLEPLKLDKIGSLEAFDCYWLRTPSGTNGLFTAVGSWGGVSNPNINNKDVDYAGGVRPAIWISEDNTQTASLDVGPATEEREYHSKDNNDEGHICTVCNGTGQIKYYYGASALEAYLSGQNNYEYGRCPTCNGTGRVK